jgi:hypothetical protein
MARTAPGRNIRNAKRRANAKKAQPGRVRHDGSIRNAGGAKCGANKRGGGTCQKAAGWGTEHPGIGRCKFHLGNAPNHVKAAASEELRTLLGKPVDVHPLDAIIMCIKIRAGEVQWLSLKMEELNEKDWVEDTIAGKQFHLYAREYRAAQDALVRYSQIAISLGIAERAVKLAETHAESIARLLNGIKTELGLSSAQLERWPVVVRRNLMLLDGIPPEQLPALPPADVEVAA